MNNPYPKTISSSISCISFSSSPLRRQGKATTYVAAPATPSAPPAPTPQDSAVAMGIFGGTAAIMSYVLLKQLVKSASIPGGASNKLAASNALVTVMGVKTVAQEVRSNPIL